MKGTFMDNLSRKEKNLKLVIEAQEGNLAAQEILLIDNKPLIKKIAQRYSFNGRVDFEDLVQEGRIGLWTAIKHFDPAYDVAFGTYATFWIRRAMINYVRMCGRVIRLPVRVNEQISLYKRAVEYLTAQLERKPTDYEVSVSLGISIYEVKFIRQLMIDVESLDEPIGDDPDGTTRGDMIASEESDIEDMVDRLDKVMQIRKAVQRLQEKQKDIIASRYGLNGKAETQAEIGERLHITGSGVQYIERQALQKLRKMSELREYKIESRLDSITNFHRMTEKVVLWREEIREGTHKKWMGEDYLHRR
jgi:RNA polymerase sigma factor (sigma-70 family)